MTDFATGTSACLVIADDSDEMRKLVRDALAGSRFDVIEAADGRQFFWALERCLARPGGGEIVVIADIYMPFYNGLDVLEAWEAGTWSYPFIMITAFPNDEIRARIEQRGAILLAKPFAMTDLRRAVARLAPSALEIIHADSGSR